MSTFSQIPMCVFENYDFHLRWSSIFVLSEYIVVELMYSFNQLSFLPFRKIFVVCFLFKITFNLLVRVYFFFFCLWCAALVIMVVYIFLCEKCFLCDTFLSFCYRSFVCRLSHVITVLNSILFRFNSTCLLFIP